MERLTERNKNSFAMAACCGKDCEYNYVCEVGGFGECRGMDDIIARLADIEDILGDDYDLDRLRELVEAHRDRRCVIYQKGFPVASTYYKQIDGLCVREASGVVSEEEYEAAVKRGWDG